LKRHVNSKSKTRHPASSEHRNLASVGPDPLFFDGAEGTFSRRKIDVEAWSEGESSPPEQASTFKLTGRLRELPDYEMMERIDAEKRDLRRKIAGSPQFVRDFNFFLDKIGWYPETLLNYLYWDSDMMDFSPQTMVSREKKRKWPIDRKDLQEMLKRFIALAVQIERMGERLNSADEEYLPRHFRDSLYNLRCSASDLRRKLSDAKDFWAAHKERWESVVNKGRRTSFYEQIRATTGQYHEDRLCRLVNAARKVRGIAAIEKNTFKMWLNRLKKRHR
jgi:hypothetical protein